MDERTVREMRVGTLVMGLVFIGIGIAALVGTDTDPAWVWVCLFGAAGLAGLVATARSAWLSQTELPNHDVGE